MTTPPPPDPSSSSSPPLIIALSGPTSSGKTTLATALRYIFSPPTYPFDPLTIHQDDFYKTDAEIPVTEGGLQDWDCEGAINWGDLEGVVRGVKEGGGRLGRGGGGGGEGGEDGKGEERVRQGNFEGEVVMDGVHGVAGISESVIQELRQEIAHWDSSFKKRQIVIIDGFLLLGHSVPPTLTSLFSLKILLRATYTAAKSRREKRNGYVTLEGFWQDPEGYFDEVVWPGYVREHGWLFEGGDVEGVVREEVGVRVGELDGGLEGGLRWVVGVVREGLEGRGGG